MEPARNAKVFPDVTKSIQGEMIHQSDTLGGNQLVTTDETNAVGGVIESRNEEYDADDPDQDDILKSKILKRLIPCIDKKSLQKDKDDEQYGFTETSRTVPDSSSWQTTSKQRLPRAKTARSNADKGNKYRYDFSYPERGYLVIIVNNIFNGKPDRDGADIDLQNIKEVSQKFGFRLFKKGQTNNISKRETINLLKDVQQMDHSKCDCFMLVISSHGKNNDLVCADEKNISMNRILKMFNDQNCPSLRNKPKLFIIQACRGDKKDKGVDVYTTQPQTSVDATDGTCLPMSPDDENEERSQSRDIHSLNQSVDEVDADPIPGSGDFPGHAYCDNDMLVMYAIPEGMVAWRDSTFDGSWMIHFLHQVFMKYDMSHPENLLRLLTNVAAEMSNRTTKTTKDRYKAISVIEHRLLKHVIFQKKVVAAD